MNTRLRRSPQPFRAATDRARLRLEALEGRDAPAALVAAVFSGGVLTLSGLDSSVAADNAQQLSVVGTGPGSVRVSAGQNTQFQGTSETTLNFSNVQSIAVDLRSGDDLISFNDLDLSGAVTANLGAGADRLVFGNGDSKIGGTLAVHGGADDNSILLGTGSGTVSVGGLTVTAGAGKQTVTVGGDSFTSAGAVKIDLGTGGSAVRLQAAHKLHVGGNLDVRAGAGANGVTIGVAPTRVIINGVRVTLDPGTDVSVKAINLKLGAGGADLTVSGAAFSAGAINVATAAGNDSLAITSDAINLAGRLSVDTGAGNATVAFGSPDSTMTAQDVRVRSGNGDTTTTFTGPATVGNFRADHREGHDTFRANDDFTAGGSVMFNNGGGGSDTTFAGNTRIAGNFVLLGRDGFDRLTITGPIFEVGGMFNVNFGAGGSNVTVASGTKFRLARDLLIRATAGEDVIFFAGPVRARSLRLDLGDGAADVTLGGDMSLTGSLSVLTKAGDDVIRVVDAVNVGGAVKVLTGAGDDVFNWVTGSDSKVDGKFEVDTAAGNDRVSVSGVTVGGQTRLKTAAGNDDMRLDDATLNGKVHIDLGAGNDALRIAAANSNRVTTFARQVLIALAAGDDLVDIGVANNTNNFGVFNGAVKVAGSAGNDTLLYLPTSQGGTRANVFAQALVASGIETTE